MIQRFGTLCASVCLAFGCTSFDRALTDFDIMAGPDPDAPEPTSLAYSANVEAWKLELQQVDEEVDEDADQNPSGFARDRLLRMVDLARGDLERIAIVAPRLSLVATLDDSPLNRIIATEGMSALLDDLGVDPLENWIRTTPRTATERDALLTRLAARDPEARPSRLSAAEVTSYVELLREAVATPMDTPTADRALMQRLALNWFEEDDRRWDAPSEAALVRSIGNGFVRIATAMLRSPDVRLREAAAHLFHRRSGARAVPMLLQRLSSSRGSRVTYSPSVDERRMLLRMCSSLREDALFASFEGGPRPIDFLYDTLSRDEDESLRFIAIETMARCVGRPISFDREWADAWWRDLALRGTDG